MRRVTRSWAFRIGALVLAGSLLYATAYLLLPRTADGVSVTVLHCATVQVFAAVDCPGTTLFQKIVADDATVSAVHATLDGMPYQDQLHPVFCHGGWAQVRIYRFDLLWHGMVVKSYVAPINRGARCFWHVTTLGVDLLASEGATTWQDLLRLTGMPDVPRGPLLGRTAVP